MIFANGDWQEGAATSQALNEAVEIKPLVIAADGGLRNVLALGLKADALIGDMDSAPGNQVKQLLESGAKVIQHPIDKNETDLELCIAWALMCGCDSLRILAATGGRNDQNLGNILLLSTPELRNCDAAIVAGSEILRVHHPGEHQFQGNPGERFSLLPLAGDARGIRSRGLRYPLIGETLAFGRGRGISNEMISTVASLEFTEGILLSVQEVSTP